MGVALSCAWMYSPSMQTSMRVSAETRDALAEIAVQEGGVTLDEALRILIFERETQAAYARLMADPQAYQEHLRENRDLAEVDVAITE